MAEIFAGDWKCSASRELGPVCGFKRPRIGDDLTDLTGNQFPRRATQDYLPSSQFSYALRSAEGQKLTVSWTTPG